MSEIWRLSSSGQDLGLWFRYAWVRIPSGAPFKEALVRVFFLCADEGENPFEGSSEERAECEVLLQRVENSKAKHVDTFNASDSRQSHQAPHKKDFGICQGLFYLSDEDEDPLLIANYFFIRFI